MIIDILKILMTFLTLLQLLLINIDIIKNLRKSRYGMAIIGGILVIFLIISLLKVLKI